MTDDELDLVLTDTLLEALYRRFDGYIFCGLLPKKGDGYGDIVTRYKYRLLGPGLLREMQTRLDDDRQTFDREVPRDDPPS